MFSPRFLFADCMNLHIAVDFGSGCCHSFRGDAISDAISTLLLVRSEILLELMLVMKSTRQLVCGDTVGYVVRQGGV